MQPFRPEALTVDQAVHFSWSNDGDRLYITRHTPTQYLINGSVDDFSGIQTVNRYEPATGKITDLTVRNFDPSDIAPSMASQQRNTGWDGLVGGPSRVVEDPDDPDVWYQAFNGQPFFVFRGNEVEASFNSKTATTPPAPHEDTTYLSTLKETYGWVSDTILPQKPHSSSCRRPNAVAT